MGQNRKSISPRESQRERRIRMVKVAIVTTSHEDLGSSGKKTGFWFEELAAPFYVSKDKGYDVVVASIKGGDPPVDSGSLSGDFVKPECCQKAKKTTVPVASLKSGDLDAIYFVGGHGVCWDFGGDDLAALVTEMVAANKVVGAVCHGVFALFNAKSGGDPLLKGKKCTGFSETEEAAVQLTAVVPYTPESKMKDLGGLYEKGGDWGSKVVVDGNLVTGQNPASSTAVALKMVDLLA